ncbi:MAG TPA: hypothetical protein VGD14_09570 [bacterium]
MLYDKETTLGDLNSIDRDNFDHIDSKYGKIHIFQTLEQALKFVGHCVDKALKKSGVKIRPGMTAERVDRMLKSREIRVEDRDYGPEEELYLSGLFIYDKKEIVAFVSRPFYRKSELSTLPQFYVRTTVKWATADESN